MNIQIWGKSKCFETKKAERWFKERRIKFQYIDIVRYGISLGEYRSIKQALGSVEVLIDNKSREYNDLYIAYLAHEADIEQKLLENPRLFKTPIVRNGKYASVGFCPDIWKEWK